MNFYNDDDNLPTDTDLGPLCDSDCPFDCKGHVLLDVNRVTAQELYEILKDENPKVLKDFTTLVSSVHTVI